MHGICRNEKRFDVCDNDILINGKIFGNGYVIICPRDVFWAQANEQSTHARSHSLMPTSGCAKSENQRKSKWQNANMIDRNRRKWIPSNISLPFSLSVSLPWETQFIGIVASMTKYKWLKEILKFQMIHNRNACNSQKNIFQVHSDKEKCNASTLVAKIATLSTNQNKWNFCCAKTENFRFYCFWSINWWVGANIEFAFFPPLQKFYSKQVRKRKQTNGETNEKLLRI